MIVTDPVATARATTVGGRGAVDERRQHDRGEEADHQRRETDELAERVSTAVVDTAEHGERVGMHDREAQREVGEDEAGDDDAQGRIGQHLAVPERTDDRAGEVPERRHQREPRGAVAQEPFEQQFDGESEQHERDRHVGGRGDREGERHAVDPGGVGEQDPGHDARGDRHHEPVEELTEAQPAAA